jgi:hypothetical protein
VNNLNLFNEINRIARQYDDQAMQLIVGRRSKSRNQQAQLCKQFSGILYEISAHVYGINIEQPVQPQPEEEDNEATDGV